MDLIISTHNNYKSNKVINNVITDNHSEKICFKSQINQDTFTLSSLEDTKNNTLETFLSFTGIRRKNKTKRKKQYTSKDKQKPEVPPRTFLPYKNLYTTRLTANTNPDLRTKLETIEVHDIDKAEKRCRSFSKYLKENMVGFITPNGNHWFEDACKYLILASAGVPVKDSELNKYAKEFWSLMAVTDNYWLSDDFMNYLKTMNTKKVGVNTTIQAINELKNENTQTANISFKGNDNNKNYYETDLTEIKELLENGCVYSGKKFSLSGKGSYASVEHLFPHSSGGDLVNTDSNYVLALGKENMLRGNIPLTEFLKGWDGTEYEKEFPDWKQKREPFVSYNNRFTEKEKFEIIGAVKNPPYSKRALKSSLLNDNNYDVHNIDRAVERIQNLSRYLKEEMIGFITPGGEEWFNGACDYIIKGTAGYNVENSKEKYNKAKEFWGLMAKADPFWKSENFLNYLYSLDDQPAVKETTKAIKSLIITDRARNNQVSFGYSSQLRYIEKLNKACAFSNKPLNHIIGDENAATMDHIYPNSLSGDNGNSDYNYLVVSAKDNQERSNLTLTEYLLGWNASEFTQAYPNKLNQRIANAKREMKNLIKIQTR
ncbi:MAG: HNH endonuclease domain-containing protein [Vampirovibrionia bacterium]